MRSYRIYLAIQIWLFQIFTSFKLKRTFKDIHFQLDDEVKVAMTFFIKSRSAEFFVGMKKICHALEKEVNDVYGFIIPYGKKIIPLFFLRFISIIVFIFEIETKVCYFSASDWRVGYQHHIWYLVKIAQ